MTSTTSTVAQASAYADKSAAWAHQGGFNTSDTVPSNAQTKMRMSTGAPEFVPSSSGFQFNATAKEFSFNAGAQNFAPQGKTTTWGGVQTSAWNTMPAQPRPATQAQTGLSCLMFNASCFSSDSEDEDDAPPVAKKEQTSP